MVNSMVNSNANRRRSCTTGTSHHFSCRCFFVKYTDTFFACLTTCLDKAAFCALSLRFPVAFSRILRCLRSSCAIAKFASRFTTPKSAKSAKSTKSSNFKVAFVRARSLNTFLKAPTIRANNAQFLLFYNGRHSLSLSLSFSLSLSGSVFKCLDDRQHRISTITMWLDSTFCLASSRFAPGCQHTGSSSSAQSGGNLFPAIR